MGGQEGNRVSRCARSASMGCPSQAGSPSERSRKPMAGGKRAPSLARNRKPLPSRPRGRYPTVDMKWPYFVGLILGIASVARAEPALVLSQRLGQASCGMLASDGTVFQSTRAQVVAQPSFPGMITFHCMGNQGFRPSQVFRLNYANTGQTCGSGTIVFRPDTDQWCEVNYRSTRWQEDIGMDGNAIVTCTVVPNESMTFVQCAPPGCNPFTTICLFE